MKFLIILLFLLSNFLCKDSNHAHFETLDTIPLISDKVWPTSNPSETYSYYTLPFCSPKKQIRQSFGAELTGSSSFLTRYDIPFGANQDHRELCKKDLTVGEVTQFRVAVRNHYYTLMYLDNLPIKFPVGIREEVDEEIFYYLYLHLDFKIWFNGKHVIEVEVVPSDSEEKLLDVTKNEIKKAVTFSYSVRWFSTDKPHHLRWEKYISFKLFPEEIEIQWFSIMNSLILVVVLTSFVAFIMSRILTRDYAYYDEEEDKGEETGWKLLHGDIFRFPYRVNLLASILGNGVQLMTSVVLLLLLAVLGVFYPGYSNKTLYSALMIIYMITSGISGFVSAKYYKQFGGVHWVRNVMLTVILFVVPCCLSWVIMNSIALFYRSTAAFSFKLVVGVVALYVLISFPLQLIGAITAKNFTGEFDPPCLPKKAKRELPDIKWYKRGTVQILVAGFLPFSAIYIELYYFFLSIWGQIIFTPFIVVFIFFIIVIMVTSCITVAMIYIQISQEDYRWWYRAIWCGGASSIFIFGYSVFYYYFESPMRGFFQFIFYFGYNLMICYGFFLMLASVGFISSLIFLKRIYRGIKVD